jgi:hypothetical protein
MTSEDLKPGLKIPGSRWTVLGAVQRGPYGQQRTLCLCACGWWKVVDSGSLIAGTSRSCGCLRNEVARQMLTTHGMSDTPTYISWQCMLRRCYNPNDQAYPEYGGAGVKVCEAWLKFEGFLLDMGERPAGTTLDRIDASKGYEPGNVRWATIEVQNNHLKTCRYIEDDGERLSVADWARKLGLPYWRAYDWLVTQHLSVDTLKRRIESERFESADGKASDHSRQ